MTRVERAVEGTAGREVQVTKEYEGKSRKGKSMKLKTL